MTINKIIWISTISTIAVMELAIYLHFQSWNESFLLYLLPFLVLIPLLVASKNIAKSKKKNEDLASNKIHLETKMKQAAEEIEKYQDREKAFANIISLNNAFVFSYDMKSNEWFIPTGFHDSSRNPFLTEMEIIEENIHEEDKKYFSRKKKEWFTGTPTTMEFRTVKNNQIRWNELRTNSITNASGGVETILGMIIDVTDRKEKEERLAQMAYYDRLTELPNRTMLKSHLGKAISRANRKEHEITIMFIDLDGFKEVNDTLGHDVGDALLKEVAIRLNDSVREEDLISRLGGDEFIIVFEETSKDEVSVIANRILQNVSKPYHILENEASVTPSIGISMYPDDGNNIESLIKNADKAMYLAKNNGKANYQFYTPELEDYQPKDSLFDKFLKIFQK